VRTGSDGGPDDARVARVVLDLVDAIAVRVVRVKFGLDPVGSLGVVLEFGRTDVPTNRTEIVECPVRFVA
jgi:hypothetical protein